MTWSMRCNICSARNNPLTVKNFTRECQERKSWCAEMPSPTPRVSPPAEIPATIPTTCGPTKPPIADRAYPYCNFQKQDTPTNIRDPCDECTSTRKSTTEFVACWSMPPPTAFAKLQLCNPTTKTCLLIPCTYRVYNQIYYSIRFIYIFLRLYRKRDYSRILLDIIYDCILY